MLKFDLASIFHNVLVHNLLISYEKGAKKDPRWDRSWAQDSDEEGYLKQLAHASIFTRLIFILMHSLYSYIFWFYLHKNDWKSYFCCTICIFLHRTRDQTK